MITMKLDRFIQCCYQNKLKCINIYNSDQKAFFILFVFVEYISESMK